MNWQPLKHFNPHLKPATCTFIFLGAIAVGFFPTRLAAQANGFSPAVQDSTARATPGTRYRAGWFHRLLLGNGYRDSWIQPIEVPLLDLAAFAGGLTPLCTGGGMQTRSLRLAGEDGRQYVFRSVDKDPSAAILPPLLRKTFVDDLLRDQASAAMPTGGLVVAPLLDAVGVLHSEPQLVVMPDHSALGPDRETFAGILGLIELRPGAGATGTRGFAGSDRIEGTEYVWDKIEDSPRHRVDARAFLTARLMDILIGDWDRHYDQWRWARYPDEAGYIWRPIPRDRDNAFARFDGAVHWLARPYMPQLVNFSGSYPGIYGLTWSGRALDRRFLAGLERPVWDSVSQAIQNQLTDSIIEGAIGRLPMETSPADAAFLSQALKQRRNELPEAAARFYAQLAQQVDIHATDKAEVAEILRVDASRVEVKLFRVDSARSGQNGNRISLFRRTFNRNETREIRLYLHGGNDTAVIRGDVPMSILVRIIGGGGNDVLLDSSRVAGSSMASFHDARGNNLFVGRGILVDRERFRPPPRASLLPSAAAGPGSCGDSVPDSPPRDLEDPFQDWGSLWFPVPWLSYQPDVGVVIGMGVQRFAYGFRKVPHDSRIDLRAGFASGPDRFYIQWLGDFRDLAYKMDAAFDVRYSGIDIVRFHGLGNETELFTNSDEFYQITQQKLSAGASVTFFPLREIRLAIGPFLSFTSTRLGEGNFIDSIRPYGTGSFTEMGIQGGFTIDTRDRSLAATSGFHLRGAARLVPTLLEVRSTFASMYGEAASYLTADVLLNPTLALRVGGKKVWGEAPFHELAFLGGARTVRGYSEQRFAGQAALYGNAELRMSLIHFSVGDVGIFGLGDVGRVYVEDESSRRWHRAGGGGMWFALLSPANTVSLSAVRSAEGTAFYTNVGFMF